MSATRSILLIFLSFSVGFVGPLVVVMLGPLFGSRFVSGTLPTLIVLSVFWGSPRGIVERKLVEVLLGIGMALLGLVAIQFYDSKGFIEAVVSKASQVDVIKSAALDRTVLVEVVRNAFLGLAIGAVDGIYERRIGKALLGAALGALLSAPGAFVYRLVPESAQETFRMAIGWAAVICLIHAGTIIPQFFTREKYHQENQ